MSDLEIIEEGGTFSVHMALARPDDRWRLPTPSPIDFEASPGLSYASCYAGNGVGGYACGNPKSANGALHYNVALKHDRAAIAVVVLQTGSFYVAVRSYHFSALNLPGQYAGYLWGDSGDGFSNGSINQCIESTNTTSDPSVAEYEVSINSIIDDALPLPMFQAFDVELTYDLVWPSGSAWYYWELDFRRGVFMTP